MLTDDSFQSKGGKARAGVLSAERRSEIAKQGGQARWKIPRATHFGTLKLVGVEIPCFNLDDGRRVISGRGLTAAIGMKGRGQGVARIAGHKLINTNENKGLAVAISEPIEFIGLSPQGVGATSDGYEATVLQELCEALLKARDAGLVVSKHDQRYVQFADMLIRSFARVGIIALVDEATGFQKDRAKEALAEILEKFIAKELQEWTRTFPVEFYEHIFRLQNWPFNPKSVRRPSVIGHYTNNIIYKRLAPGVLKELREKNPVIDGRRKHKLFQWLTGQIGHPKLKSHIDGVLALMRVSDTWDEFTRLVKKAYPIIETTELGMQIEIKER